MRPTMGAGVAALVACAASASADDAPAKDDAESAQPTLAGEIRAGFRLLSGEYQGRFPQDVALKDGPRLFDLDATGTDPRRGAPVDEMELRLDGVGDANSDYLLSLRKRGEFQLSAGYRRDAYDYVATGDPFAYDTIRERTFVRGLWTPDANAAVRFSWDRNERRGNGTTFGEGYDSSGAQAPQLQPRAFTQEADRFALGGDYAVGVFRFGLTQSVGVDQDHDKRNFDPVNATELSVRAISYATAAKAGVSLLDGTLDATLFVTRTTSPMDERENSASDVLHSTDSTTGRLRREAMNWRFETSWRPVDAWEFTLAGEQDDVVDDQSGIDVARNLPPGGTPTSTRKPFADARVADRERRASLDATWDTTKELRLRLGEQYVREELFVPTESHFSPYGESLASHPGTDLTSNAFRTTAGADWRPSKALSASALAHFSVNDTPQTTTVPRRSDDWTTRLNWRPLRDDDGAPSNSLVLTTLWRRQVLDHQGAVPLADIRFPNQFAGPRPDGTTDLNSVGRTSSLSESAAWSSGPWTVRATGTFRRFDTATDTAFYSTNPKVNALEYVSFRGRDFVADLDVHYAVTKTLRVFTDLVRTTARDASNTRTSTSSSHATSDASFDARTVEASVGAEYDFGRDVKTDGETRKEMTLGLTLSTWRRADFSAPRDSYRVYGVEVSLAYRF